VRSWLKSILAGALGLVLPTGVLQAQSSDLTVFAAASLKNGLDAVIASYEQETGQRVAASYAASSALARQIEQGAPADLFISADLAWMDYLEQRHLIRPGSRRDLLGNRLVLVAPKGEAKAVELTQGRLSAALRDGRLAIAAVAGVPAGKYGKAALEHLGLWPEVAGRLAQAENVRRPWPSSHGASRPSGSSTRRMREPTRTSRSWRAFPRQVTRRSCIRSR
jgi:molybdate transport system substrate-binding protein